MNRALLRACESVRIMYDACASIAGDNPKVSAICQMLLDLLDGPHGDLYRKAMEMEQIDLAVVRARIKGEPHE